MTDTDLSKLIAVAEKTAATMERIERLFRRTLLEREFADACGIASVSTTEDPVVRFLPAGWKDGDFKGRKFSGTNANFLRRLRHAFVNMADKDDAEKRMYKDRPSSTYKRRDAAVAARWIVRFELGEVSESSAPPQTAADLPAFAEPARKRLPDPVAVAQAAADSFGAQSTFYEYASDDIPF